MSIPGDHKYSQRWANAAYMFSGPEGEWAEARGEEGAQSPTAAVPASDAL
jgi:hypothetical protein